jgi:hypothetical protein
MRDLLKSDPGLDWFTCRVSYEHTDEAAVLRASGIALFSGNFQNSG